jgi:predicted MPP superfamily phosphohydrolase
MSAKKIAPDNERDASERRSFPERLTGWIVRRPFRDAQGGKGLFAPFARAQAHVVRHYALTLPGWPRFERPLRIVLLADFHIGSHTGDVARHAAIAKDAAAFLPDLVLLGGDYVNMQLAGGGRVPPRVIARMLARIMGRHGRFAILGNHDYIYGEREVAAALHAHGIAVLDHARDTFTFGRHQIDVIGVPDAHVARPQAQALLASLKPDRPAIVLLHDPAWFKDVPAGPFLTLAGHTHGGQISLPGLGVVRNASRAPLRWSHGLVVEGGRHLIVTAGLGTSGIPLRIGVPPEFVLIEVTGL